MISCPTLSTECSELFMWQEIKMSWLEIFLIDHPNLERNGFLKYLFTIDNKTKNHKFEMASYLHVFDTFST